MVDERLVPLQKLKCPVYHEILTMPTCRSLLISILHYLERGFLAFLLLLLPGRGGRRTACTGRYCVCVCVGEMKRCYVMVLNVQAWSTFKFKKGLPFRRRRGSL